MTENQNTEKMIKEGLWAVELLEKARIFKIPSELASLFLRTDCKYMPPLPFENVFLETSFKIDASVIVISNPKKMRMMVVDIPNVVVNGIFLIQGDETNITVLCLLKDEIGEKHPIIFDMPLTNKNDLENATIANFINNFLCFINSPEIEYVDNKDTGRQTKIRRRKGKPSRLLITSIILTNPLKRYITKLRSGEFFTYSHKFWVRGHWRTYDNPYFKNVFGKKQWIKPYIKGDGLLIPKNYELKL